MQVYFSHSYRDIPLNSYFIEQFAEEEIPLRADQKTDIWCVAKLERYLGEMTGLISIIPNRPTETDPYAYSPYIGQELTLARRARLPRLLFVDKVVLNRHQLDFPKDAVPFQSDSFDKKGSDQHRSAIRDFRLALETTYRPRRTCQSRQVTVIYTDIKKFRPLVEDLSEILKREGFVVTTLTNRGLEDIRLLENILDSELCVFLLGDRLSETHIALAMAHAHCIPSIRLFYSDTAADSNPTVSGAIYWQSEEILLGEFARQITSYKMGLVQPVEMARDSNATSAALSVGTMRGWERKENLWNLRDGDALIEHIFPNHAFVRDEVGRARQELKRSLDRERGREASLEICRLLYDGIKRHHFGYEVELQSGTPGFQAIRTPTQIETHQTATCIDLACLFAALLESSLQDPIIAIVENADSAHALVGYRGRDEPPWDSSSLGDLRGAVQRGDAILLEATGCVEATSPVGAETEQERHEKLLAFADAQLAAKRMLFKSNVRLRHLIDVRSLRQRN